MIMSCGGYTKLEMGMLQCRVCVGGVSLLRPVDGLWPLLLITA